jgi:hypothetical protein
VVDIQSIVDKFVMEVDTAQQQQRQALLDDTNETIRDAIVKRIAIGHFLQILEVC